MVGRGQKALPKGRKRLVDPPEGQGGFRGPTQWAGSGRHGLGVFPELQKGSRVPAVGPGVVRRPAQLAGRGREALLEGKERSGGPPGWPGVVGRTSQRPGRSGGPP